VVDTLGLIWVLSVHAAHLQDRDAARSVIACLQRLCPRLERLWADGGYAGALVEWVQATFGWILTIVKRSDDAKGFEVLPHRWIVERTFGWLGRYRRLSKDYEFLPQSSEAWIRVAMIHVMLRKLTKT
jgi:putative transposase